MNLGDFTISGVVIDRFITAETSADETKFISIVPADEANDIIQVLVR